MPMRIAFTGRMQVRVHCCPASFLLAFWTLASSAQLCSLAAQRVQGLHASCYTCCFPAGPQHLHYVHVLSGADLRLLVC
jgi:hypothetical protein